ncbi:MAG: FKBP-type peptidyl-prolyl cis-trans isomerase, partial [Deltaproteobacteria bacterium]
MQITKNAVVSIDYTLRDDQGEVLDSSDGDEPLIYLHGQGQIIEGLENALDGRSTGDAFKITVSPKDGYGEKSATGAVRVPSEELPEGPAPEIGMELEAVGPNGEVATLYVVGVEKDAVMLSTDHPLAGVTLHFDVSIREVREASADEMEHGHVHGPGGAHYEHDHDDHDDDEGPAVFGEINITPLTDIFLVLLIIFMVTSTTLVEQGQGGTGAGVRVDLPKGAAREIA